MNINNIDLYAGLSGCKIEPDNFDFGQNIIISKTYANLMLPFLVTFLRPKKNDILGGYMRNAHGGYSFILDSQIYIPKSIDKPNGLDLVNTGWIFASLLRLRSIPNVILVLYSNTPFVKGGNSKIKMELWPIEVEPNILFICNDKEFIIDNEILEWVKQNWRICANLMESSKKFNFAFRTFSSCQFLRSPSMSLLAIWSALESLFSPGRTELRFRISSNIAVYMEEAGEQRFKLQEKLLKLYDYRSHAAHGIEKECSKQLIDSYNIMKRCLIKIIESNHVPTQKELNSKLFCYENNLINRIATENRGQT